MPKYKALFNRIESRVLQIECEAQSEEEAKEIFDIMTRGDDEGEFPLGEINFDAMECVHAEDYINDIEEIEVNINDL